MPFRRHPLGIARRTKNAEALRSTGLAAGGLSVSREPWLAQQPDYDKDRQIANLAFQGYPC